MIKRCHRSTSSPKTHQSGRVLGSCYFLLKMKIKGIYRLGTKNIVSLFCILTITVILGFYAFIQGVTFLPLYLALFANVKDIPIKVENLYETQNHYHPPRVPITPDLDIFHVDYNDTLAKDEVTIVTAFFNLGVFRKGERFYFYYPALLEYWMLIFERITNPIVVYLEDDYMIDYFKYLRRNHVNSTRIIKIRRDQLWSFSHLDEIARLFNSGTYPVHHPNTVMPEYPCVMHAKHEAVFLAAKSNFFQTKYMAWLDVGYFRDLVNKGSQEPLTIYKPPKFNEKRVAFNQVKNILRVRPPAEEIILQKKDWVGGGFFLARTSVMVKWAHQYMVYTECYLRNGLMNTDQQIIYALLNDYKICSYGLPIKIQTYHQSGKNRWFYLGNLALEEGKKRTNGDKKNTKPP